MKQETKDAIKNFIIYFIVVAVGSIIGYEIWELII